MSNTITYVFIFLNYTVLKWPENKFVTAQECNLTKRHLCYSLLCHATTNFILPYVTANLC